MWRPARFSFYCTWLIILNRIIVFQSKISLQGIPKRQTISFWRKIKTFSFIIRERGLASTHFEKQTTTTSKNLIFLVAKEKGPTMSKPHWSKRQGDTTSFMSSFGFHCIRMYLVGLELSHYHSCISLQSRPEESGQHGFPSKRRAAQVISASFLMNFFENVINLFITKNFRRFREKASCTICCPEGQREELFSWFSIFFSVLQNNHVD